jgi:putative flippase GtrA
VTPTRSLAPLVLRFGLAGLINTGFSYTAFATLVRLGAAPPVTLIGAACAGVAFNFQTSRRLVSRAYGCCLRFVALYVVVLGLNGAALRVAVQFGVPNLTAQALLAAPVAVVSFLGQTRLVFDGISRPA